MLFEKQIVSETRSYCKMMAFSEYTTSLMLATAKNLPRNTEITPAEIAVKLCALPIVETTEYDRYFGGKRG